MMASSASTMKISTVQTGKHRPCKNKLFQNTNDYSVNNTKLFTSQNVCWFESNRRQITGTDNLLTDVFLGFTQQ